MADAVLRDLLEIEHPILLAGMGGVAGPALAAAVSEAGCGGAIGLYKLDGAGVEDMVRATAALTDRPFGVNMIPEVVQGERLLEQVDAVLESAPTTTFFTFFGVPAGDTINRLHREGRRVLVQVGGVAEAGRAAALDADGCILQGREAGGHHLGTDSLADLTRAVRRSHPALPVIGAGGIGEGTQLFELERAGASGCWCGTMFVAAAESNAHSHFKERVVAASAADTVITDAFSIGWPGREHRVLRNRSVEEQGQLRSSFIATTAVAGRRHPVARFSAAVPTSQTEGLVDEMALYCGTSCDRVSATAPAAEIIERFLQGCR